MNAKRFIRCVVPAVTNLLFLAMLGTGQIVSSAGCGRIGNALIDDILTQSTCENAQNPCLNITKVKPKLVGENAGDRIGNSSLLTGDINGDGFDDILIGVPLQDGSKSAVYLVYGRADFPTGDFVLNKADAKFVGENTGDEAGYSIGITDINHDGFSDILIGAPSARQSAGLIYIIYGKATAFASQVSLATADAVFVGENPDDKAGATLGYGGDVDNDGFDDFLIGAPAKVVDPTPKYGVTCLFYGKEEKFSGEHSLAGADASFINANTGSISENRTVIGDVNGDHFDDILIDDYGIRLFNGNINRFSGVITSDPNTIFTANTIDLQNTDPPANPSSDYFSPERPFIADMNHDGIKDVLAFGEAVFFGGSTKIFIFYGKKEGFATNVEAKTADVIFDIGGDILASWVAPDVNGDGYADFLVSKASQFSILGGPGNSDVYVFYGKEGGYSGVVSSSEATFQYSQTGENDDALGAGLSTGDFNGDGLSDILIGAPFYDAGKTETNEGAVYMVFGSQKK